jgi:hypothetical protein
VSSEVQESRVMIVLVVDSLNQDSPVLCGSRSMRVYPSGKSTGVGVAQLET